MGSDHLKRHERIHKEDEPFTSLIPSSMEDGREKRFSCCESETDEPFACLLCAKAFTDEEILKKHERTHRGEKLFACSKCDQAFTGRVNLNIHERTHTGEKPYVCSICDKAFAGKKNLKKHEKIHTKEKPQSLPKDPLDVKEDRPTNTHDFLEIKVEGRSSDNQESASNISIKIENEIFYWDVKQEPM